MRLVVFDLDGTLIDTRADLRAAINAMRAGYGLDPLDLETVTGYIGNGLRKLIHRALQGHPANLDEAIARASAYYGEHLHDASSLYPGVEEGLQRLAAAGHALAVCSNKPEGWCLELLRHFRLHGLFRAVAGGDTHPVMKPHPAPVRALMETCGASPSGTWVVGDSWTDLEAARRAGARSLFLTYGYSAPGGEHPDARADSFAAAVDALLEAAPPSRPCPGGDTSVTVRP